MASDLFGPQEAPRKTSWFLKITQDPTRPRCVVDGCEKAAVTCGLCSKHYQRKRTVVARGDNPPPRAKKEYGTKNNCGRRQCPAAMRIQQGLRHVHKVAAKRSGDLPSNDPYFVGRFATHAVDLARRRARKFGLPFSITRADVLAAVVPVCPITGLVLSYGANGKIIEASPSLDRIVPERGYVPGNIAVISFRANRLKSDGTIQEFERILAMMRAAGAQESAA